MLSRIFFWSGLTKLWSFLSVFCGNFFIPRNLFNCSTKSIDIWLHEESRSLPLCMYRPSSWYYEQEPYYIAFRMKCVYIKWLQKFFLLHLQNVFPRVYWTACKATYIMDNPLLKQWNWLAQKSCLHQKLQLQERNGWTT